jgi:hypothetical protein
MSNTGQRLAVTGGLSASSRSARYAAAGSCMRAGSLHHTSQLQAAITPGVGATGQLRPPMWICRVVPP